MAIYSWLRSPLNSYVNKGPGRPVFPAMLRAEMLAALRYVEWVAVNDAPTAENVIRHVRPDVYVKGSDYVQAEDDITGKIEDERRAVEAHGGRIHFTYDITFSSSSLLNRHFDVFEPKLRSYLEAARSRWDLDEFERVVDSVKDKSVLLIGDTIIDEYHYVSPLGKSPKENLISDALSQRRGFCGRRYCGCKPCCQLLSGCPCHYLSWRRFGRRASRTQCTKVQRTAHGRQPCRCSDHTQTAFR